MNKKVSVVILNYNGAAMLEKFLPTVLECSPEATVVIADNASTDNSVALVLEKFPALQLICLDKNYGFAEGYNKALEQVDAEYYILLNSDVEVTQGWIAPLLAFMETDESVVACQPKILDYKKKVCFEYAGAAGGFIDRYGYPYCRGRLFETVEQDNGQYDEPCRIFWATGAAMMVRSKAYWAVGGLDGRFFAHMEEIDLCWRMNARGGIVYCVPQSVVYHVGGATLNKSNPYKTFLNFRNNLLLLYKNMPQKELRHVMCVRLLLDYLAAFKFVICGGWSDFKAVLKARCEYRRMRGDFSHDREQNLAMTVVSSENKRPFLLLEYYLRGRKYFNLLK